MNEEEDFLVYKKPYPYAELRCRRCGYPFYGKNCEEKLATHLKERHPDIFYFLFQEDTEEWRKIEIQID